MASGGYDCNFIDDDKSKEFSCPVCILVLRDPQLTRCGHLICESCLQQLKNEGNNFTCPTCRADLTNNCFPDERVNRIIKSLQVRCNNIKDDGCQWKGDLKDIENHLQECPYQLVSCSNDCGMDLQRRHLQDHLKNSCPKRLISCQYCFKKGHHQVVTGDHLGVCPEYPTSCINEGCGKKVPRQQMPSHKESCPKEMISCGYRSVGCEEKMKREEQEEHNDQWREQHLQLATGKVNKLHSDISLLHKKHKSAVNNLQSAIDNLQSDHQSAVTEIKNLRATNQLLVNNTCKSLEFEVNESKRKIQNAESTINTIITANREMYIKFNSFAIKKSNNTPWYSPGFYTSGGYKMCLCVDANGYGDGKGTHVSCYIYLMSGEYDDILEWPFHGEVTIELLNQLEDKNHYKMVLLFNEFTSQQSKSRLTVIGGRGAGLGYPQFISHSQLHLYSLFNRHQYLKDDALYFRVSVEVTFNNTKPWLAPITKIPKLA